MSKDSKGMRRVPSIRTPLQSPQFTPEGARYAATKQNVYGASNFRAIPVAACHGESRQGTVCVYSVNDTLRQKLSALRESLDHVVGDGRIPATTPMLVIKFFKFYDKKGDVTTTPLLPTYARDALREMNALAYAAREAERLKIPLPVPRIYFGGLVTKGPKPGAVIVMEHVRGVPLREYKRPPRPGFVTEHDYFMVAQAVKSLWKLGIIHNDLHSNNVMVQTGEDGKIARVVIIDLGHASKIEEDNRAVAVNSMSPNNFWNKHLKLRSERSMRRLEITAYNPDIYLLRRLRNRMEKDQQKQREQPQQQRTPSPSPSSASQLTSASTSSGRPWYESRQRESSPGVSLGTHFRRKIAARAAEEAARSTWQPDPRATVAAEAAARAAAAAAEAEAYKKLDYVDRVIAEMDDPHIQRVQIRYRPDFEFDPDMLKAFENEHVKWILEIAKAYLIPRAYAGQGDAEPIAKFSMTTQAAGTTTGMPYIKRDKGNRIINEAYTMNWRIRAYKKGIGFKIAAFSTSGHRAQTHIKIPLAGNATRNDDGATSFMTIIVDNDAFTMYDNGRIERWKPIDVAAQNVAQYLLKWYNESPDAKRFKEYERITKKAYDHMMERTRNQGLDMKERQRRAEILALEARKRVFQEHMNARTANVFAKRQQKRAKRVEEAVAAPVNPENVHAKRRHQNAERKSKAAAVFEADRHAALVACARKCNGGIMAKRGGLCTIDLLRHITVKVMGNDPQYLRLPGRKGSQKNFNELCQQIQPRLQGVLEGRSIRFHNNNNNNRSAKRQKRNSA